MWFRKLMFMDRLYIVSFVTPSLRKTNRAFVQGVKAGNGSLEDLLTTALSELCKVKPEGLDAVR